MSDRVRSGAQKDTVIALTVDDFYRNSQTVELTVTTSKGDDRILVMEGR